MDLNRIMRKVYNGKKEETLLPYDASEYSIEDFWNEDINYDEAEDKPEISPKVKKAAIASGAVIGAVIFIAVGVNITGFVRGKIQQAKLYSLAVRETEQGDYVSAIEHFEQIRQDNKNYSEARSSIRRLTNINTYMRQAKDFFDDDELAYALEKINSVDMLVKDYEPARELKEKILSRMEEKRSQADAYIEEGIKLTSEGRFSEAKEKLDFSDKLYPNYANAAELRELIHQKAEALAAEGEMLYSQGEIDEAADRDKQALELYPELPAAKSLEEELSGFYRADEAAQKAVEYLRSRSFELAESKMKEAIEKNSLISTKYASEIAAIADGKKLKEITDAYLQKIELTDISVVDGFADTDSNSQAVSYLNVMFTIENKTEQLICFNVYWCTLFDSVTELEPVPFSEEQVGSVVKILPDGTMDDELAGDFLYMQQGEKYKILLRFEGTKEQLADYYLYYNDFNENPVLKIDLFKIG